jgi:plastocyanin
MLPDMRRKPLLIPLAVLSPLAFASPATAADVSVSVVDFSFQASQVNVGVGEKVTWSFDAGGHTTKSDRGQPESWDSGPQLASQGATFEHTFNTPGRFTYYCQPHASFMKGTVVVGTDEHRKSQSKFSAVRRGRKVTVKFALVEAAKVSVSLSGADDRKATRKRLRPGRYSIVFKNVDPGRYRAKATFTDDFDKKSVARTTIR